MKGESLRTGALVKVHQRKLDGMVTARRRAGAIARIRGESNDILGHIPEGTRVLYMCSQEDAFNTALRAKGAGPYGYTPARVIYHFVLWGDRPVWISDAEASLERL